MARVSTVTCDWCTSQLEVRDDESPVDHGWLETAEWDEVQEDVIHRDFCLRECVVSFYA